MAQQLIVITLLSDDQPGVVQQVADIVNQHNGNWLESRMAQLAGKFAGILKVGIEPQHLKALTTALDKLSLSGIQILIDTADNTTSATGKTLTFDLVGADRVGIVNEIAQAFSEKGINIDELETQCSSIPWSGEPLFEATGILLAPSNIDTDELLHQLAAIENKLGVDINLNEQL